MGSGRLGLPSGDERALAESLSDFAKMVDDGLTVHVKIGDPPVTRPNPLPLHRRCGRDRLESKLGSRPSIYANRN
jgi:hypothetical protein